MTIPEYEPLIARSMQDTEMRIVVNTNDWYGTVEVLRGPENIWPEPAMTIEQFEHDLAEVYPPPMREDGGIAGWLGARLQEGNTANVLNCMGNTVVLMNLHQHQALSGGIAIGLSDTMRPTDEETEVRTVVGDVLLARTWQALDNTMQSAGIPDFDLILCVPKLGFTNAHVSRYPDVTRTIYDHLYRRLKPGGMMLAEFSNAIRYAPDVQYRWIEEIRTANPAEPVILTSKYYFSLVKTLHLPVLPEIHSYID